MATIEFAKMSRRQKRVLRRWSYLNGVRGVWEEPTMKSVVQVPNLKSLVHRGVTETPITSAALSPAQPDHSAGVLQKCLSYLQTEFNDAMDEEIKYDLQEQMKYLQKIQGEVSARGPTGAEFLGGETNPFSQSRSYTRWPGYDVFGESQTQWIYYHGSDGLMRYEHRTGFVFKENPTTRSLVRAPEHPQCFYPDRYFQPNAFAIMDEYGWCGTFENEIPEEFPTILARTVKAENDRVPSSAIL